MKAIHALLLGCISAASLPLVSLEAQQNSIPPEAINRLEASRTFNVNTPAASTTGPGYPQLDPRANQSADPATTIDYNPFKNSPLEAPPPVETPETARNPRRVNPTNAKNEKDADWLLNGVEQQRKILEEQEKALTKESTNSNALTSSSALTSTKRDSKNNLSTSTGSSAMTSGLGVYSRYTTSGLEALKQPAGTAYDPLAIHSSDKSSLAPDPTLNPLTAPEDGVKIQSPILDPLAIAKAETTPGGVKSGPNSRISVNDWMTTVKERQRLSLQPQHAPSIADLYDQNQIRLKAPDPKLPTTPAPTLNRPKAANVPSPMPKKQTIRDPNDF